MRGLLANSYDIPLDGPSLPRLFQKIGGEMIAAFAIPFMLLMLAALCGNLIQHQLVWSAQTLAPKLSKISLLAGMKRLFSLQALANFAKGIVKLLLVGSVLTALMWPERHRLEGLVRSDLAVMLALLQSLALKLLGAVVAIMAILAAAITCSNTPVVPEAEDVAAGNQGGVKHTEATRPSKGKMRQLRQSKSRRRMMAAVPKAAVVITKPDPLCHRLQYERGMEAPICVAKGVDALAGKSGRSPPEHAVPVVENPPLARALHATVDVDEAIPPEHYKAVAEVIGYVMKLRRAIHK